MQSYEILEHKWADFNKLPRDGMVVCNSGTAALHLGMEALQLPLGSNFVTSDFNMIAVPRAIALAGHVPIFVDCTKRLLMDTLYMNRGLKEPNTYGVIATHIYGRRCPMEEIAGSPNLGSLFLIEDLAEAHGVQPHHRTDIACWSFYKNKIVAGEEGGAVWFRSPTLAERARMLRSLGFTEAHDFMHVPRGHNYRMSNVHADLILNSIADYPTTVHWRAALVGTYDHYCPSNWKMPKRNANWVYDIRIPGMSSSNQTRVVKFLNERGIAARHAFKPMRMQPEFQNCQYLGEMESVHSCSEVIYLPVNASISEDNISQAFKVISSCL